MEDFIEALRIFQKYMKEDCKWPFYCEHDILMVCCVGTDVVSEEDKKRLDELGFIPVSDYGEEIWGSYRFGSC